MEPSAVTLRQDPTTSQQRRSSSPEDGDDGGSGQKKSAPRKRTKTGCLTCRRRRIKCDEGRPTCNNCIKSKRQCDGYNQRVIFKDPLGAFASAPYGPIHYPSPSPQALVREQQLSAAQQRSSSQSLQIIAPKPPTVGYHQVPGSQFGQFYSGQAGPSAASSGLLNFDRGHFSAQPAPTKYTFFPPTTVDAFSQNQWRQPSVEDLAGLTPIVAEEDFPDVSSTDPDHIDHAGKGKTPVQATTTPTPAREAHHEDWVCSESESDYSMEEDSADDFSLMPHDSRLHLTELGLAMAHQTNQPYHFFSTQTRTFSTHATEHILSTYDPSPVNSPLNDKKVAAVFWHFVNVTGPSMSLYERHPHDPSELFQGQPVPRSRQHLWSYTFPLQSLSHAALLQAILAMASLQIAKLQSVPPTASLKHYHLALRRIAKNVSRPGRRAQAANLAATLVLAFYEVWNSDHDKWSRHLLGARWILKDIPMSEMTRAIMAIKMGQRQRQRELGLLGPGHFEFGARNTDQSPLHRDWDLVDVPFLCVLTGRDLTWDQFGMLPEEMSSLPPPRTTYTNKDMERYEHLSDLFWWYCKMDVYQSILGGTRTFLEYDSWMQCPPRAPMGRLDAVYGTYDHLILLLGRMTAFVCKDLSRKRAVMKASEKGAAGPPAGMFAGMVPASEKVTLPMGFSPPRDDSPHDEGSPKVDLDTRSFNASQEWESIRQAFEEFKDHVGPEFKPLGPDLYRPTATPFGPTAHYRTYSIACIWMNYYMGLIVLHRAHPTMPPIAMVAAGMSARSTHHYTMELGRIAAGLEENISHLAAVTTLKAAALIESAFPLFVAGIQYQDIEQRHWLVRRLLDIARLTGWQSATQIAQGCESAWSKAAQFGRGPPYQRPADVSPAPTTTVPNPHHHGFPADSTRRIDRRIREVDSSELEEGGKIVLAKGEKAHYAMGLLSVEQDLERLDLDDEDRER
ncbi:hypothetical protein F4780DRAFT_364080 [Xylariomycetidae sp. FL0641]|nr:hypothetical protein F4780DRAFT_364080 [Xylariomycetidae sp. FL0641]